ncbi:MAG: hypothetical protein CSA42_02590 [Gammaproteobacteria bacterium]|nr:MAG: hypothetical protein CSA42_02590 [Gammaproteobacteria bacterium]
MCIVAIAWQLFEKMPLIVLSNRDEFLDRPTLQAHQWADLPIFAGRDEKSGGTWLGYHQSQTGNQNGRWATILNFREVAYPIANQPSRGQLVTDFLTSDLSPMAFAKQIKLNEYAGFNLVLGDTNPKSKQAVFVNNRGVSAMALHNGLHVFSNGQPDAAWFKCERLRTQVYQEILPLIAQNITTDEWQKVAFEVLSDSVKSPKDKIADTGLPTEVEQALSSIFIEHNRLNNYGTRSQSVLTSSQQDNGKLVFLINELSCLEDKTHLSV